MNENERNVPMVVIMIISLPSYVLGSVTCCRSVATFEGSFQRVSFFWFLTENLVFWLETYHTQFFITHSFPWPPNDAQTIFIHLLYLKGRPLQKKCKIKDALFVSMTCNEVFLPGIRIIWMACECAADFLLVFSSSGLGFLFESVELWWPQRYEHFYFVRDSSVSIATDYGLAYQMIGVRIPAGAGNFSLPQPVQTGSRAHPPSYPRGSFPEGKAAGPWSWPLTSI
jgi:hypothetical protein